MYVLFVVRRVFFLVNARGVFRSINKWNVCVLWCNVEAFIR